MRRRELIVGFAGIGRFPVCRPCAAADPPDRRRDVLPRDRSAGTAPCQGIPARAPSDGSAWLSNDCRRRVIRGGAWNSGPCSLRSANRGFSDPVSRSSSIGFRVARTLLGTLRRKRLDARNSFYCQCFGMQPSIRGPPESHLAWTRSLPHLGLRQIIVKKSRPPRIRYRF